MVLEGELISINTLPMLFLDESNLSALGTSSIAYVIEGNGFTTPLAIPSAIKYVIIYNEMKLKVLSKSIVILLENGTCQRYCTHLPLHTHISRMCVCV